MLDTDRFIERELIGRGGMGWVIRAFDRHLHRDVAIKVLAPERSCNTADVERFINEARITGQLEHPYVVPVYDLGLDRRGQRFLCMRLLSGETLESTLDWAGPSRLSPGFLSDLLQVFCKVCDAVSFAHSRGIVHRDLKPSNIMISDFGQVYVMDWGIARTSRAAEKADDESSAQRGLEDPPGVMLGTPCYMSPEQLRGLHDQIDERSDVFALGAILYRVLVGRPPYGPEELAALRSAKARVDVPLPALTVAGNAAPPELMRIAQKAMAYEPIDRYASVAALLRDVERFRRGTWQLPLACLAAGSIVVVEGERGESAYIIVEGRCVVYRSDGRGGEVILREMGPGDVFGETAVLSDKPRTASVRASTDLVMMVVTADSLSNALGANFWMGSFVRALADRFREHDERIRQRDQLSAPGSPRSAEETR